MNIEVKIRESLESDNDRDTYCCSSCESEGVGLGKYDVIINPATLEKESFYYCDLCASSKASLFSRATYPISNKEIACLICFVGNKVLKTIKGYINE